MSVNATASFPINNIKTESINIPNPTTESPITAPPANATSRAFASPPSLAAIEVLPLALVAILIPIFPARAEVKAPNTKATAVFTEMNIPNAAPTITTNHIRILYSATRNAIAPSLIASVISATFGMLIS